jgi:carboxypeptidase Q
MFLVVALLLQAVEPVDHQVIARLKMEGFQSSQVMETLSYLTDVHGPRLTGSPGYRAAAAWSRDRLKEWGLNAALESWGEFGRGWSADRFSVEMLAPQYMRVIAYPKAWTPSLNPPLTGKPTVVEVKSKEDFEKYRGKLKGAIVMNGKPVKPEPHFTADARRLSDEDLTGQLKAIEPGEPKSYWLEDEEWKKEEAKEKEITAFFREEGIAVLLQPSTRDHGVVRVSEGGSYDPKGEPTFPAFVLAREHYNRIARLVEKNIDVQLELSLAARFHDDDTIGYNVVAEIPGTDPKLKDQIVMLGGHLDSWHSGTGATDNAVGCAVVMEAVRILQAVGAKPRRTIRLALWGGEEQGYFGSVGYVKKHFGDPATMALHPEHARLSAYYNIDNGTGKIRGVHLQGNEMARPIFEAYLAPFHYLGATTLTTENTGGTDHMVFDAVGLPGFQFIQDPIEYGVRTHHTNMDVYDYSVEPDLKQAAVIIASFVYHTAMREEMIPRKPLPKPRPKEGKETAPK